MTKPAALVCGAALLLLPFAAPAAPAAQPGLRVLAFTKTAGFRHDSIPAALRALRELGTANGIAVDATEDASVFSDAGLARYDAVIFLSTTGDVLDDVQQGAFERYVRGGGGYAGVHSAADTEYGWAWYGELVGAYFRSHPDVQRAAIQVLARDASTARLPRRWVRTDEWYSFASSPTQPCPGPRGWTKARTTRVEARWAPTTPSPGRTRWAEGARGTRAAGIRPSRTPSRSSARTSSAGSSTPPATRGRGLRRSRSARAAGV